MVTHYSSNPDLSAAERWPGAAGIFQVGPLCMRTGGFDGSSVGRWAAVGSFHVTWAISKAITDKAALIQLIELSNRFSHGV